MATYFDSAAQYPLLPGVIESIKGRLNQPMYHLLATYGSSLDLKVEQDLKTKIAAYYSSKFKGLITEDNVILGTSASELNRYLYNMFSTRHTMHVHKVSHSSVLEAAKANKVKLEQQPAVLMFPSITPLTGTRIDSFSYPNLVGAIIDDTQGFIKYPDFFPKLDGIDLLGVVCNAAKIGGIPGIAAAVVANPMQARNFKSTLNNPLALIGFSSAIDAWQSFPGIKENLDTVTRVVNTRIKSLCEEKPQSIRRLVDSSSNIMLLATKLDKVKVVHLLIDLGIMVSETSACSSKVPQELYEYLAVDKKTESFLRISWSHFTTDSEIDLLISTLEPLL